MNVPPSRAYRFLHPTSKLFFFRSKVRCVISFSVIFCSSSIAYDVCKAKWMEDSCDRIITNSDLHRFFPPLRKTPVFFAGEEYQDSIGAAAVPLTLWDRLMWLFRVNTIRTSSSSPPYSNLDFSGVEDITEDDVQFIVGNGSIQPSSARRVSAGDPLPRLPDPRRAVEQTGLQPHFSNGQITNAGKYAISREPFTGLFDALFFNFRVYLRIIEVFWRAVPVAWSFLVCALKSEVDTQYEPAFYKLKALFLSLGPTYVKLSQWIATRPDLFPQELCTILSSSFDNVTPAGGGGEGSIFSRCIDLVRDAVGAILRRDMERLPTGTLTSQSLAELQEIEVSQCDGIITERVLGVLSRNFEVRNKQLESTSRAAMRRRRGSEGVCDLRPDHCTNPEPLRHVSGVVGYLSEVSSVSINSGSIGKVFTAVLTKDVDGIPRGSKVAIKILHRNVEDLVWVDICVFEKLAYAFSWLVSGSRFFDPLLCWYGFSALLLSQLDLQREADNIMQFRHNFANRTGDGESNSKGRDRIVFPRPLPSLSSRRVLVETFEKGVPLMVYCSALDDQKANPLSPPSSYRGIPVIASTESARRLADIGVGMFLKMIFEDNFVHADLHPGNILVRTNSTVPNISSEDIADNNASIKKAGVGILKRICDWRHKEPLNNILRRLRTIAMEPFRSLFLKAFGVNMRDVRIFRFFDDFLDVSDGEQLVVLDCGLTTALGNNERNNFILLFSAVATGDSDLAADLMLRRSPYSEYKTPDEVKDFKRDMREIFEIVMPGVGPHTEGRSGDENRGTQQTEGFRLSRLKMNVILTKICECMRKHRVTIDGRFSTLVVTVMIGEGIGHRLCADYNIFATAAPYLITQLLSSGSPSTISAAIMNKGTKAENEAISSGNKVDAEDSTDSAELIAELISKVRNTYGLSVMRDVL